MKLNLSNRLSYKLARNTVLVALLIGLFLNLFQVLIDYINQKDALNKDIQSIITISHTPASQIAYNIDSRLAEELLEGLLKHPAIIEAEIIDSDNRVLALAQRSRKMSESPYRWLSDLLFDPTQTFTSHLSVKQLPNVDLGNLNVTVDTYPAGTAFLKRASFTIISGFFKSLILAVLLLILFYIMLTKPLLKVIDTISQADPESPEKARLPIPKGHEHDEIGILVESTNLHLQSIEKNLQRVRQAEFRLKNYSEQLELIVDSRTHELSEKNDQLVNTNEQLVIAKEEAINRAKARADFLASMSHEIRTPFNGVLGMISLTLEEPLSERQKRQLEVAYNSGMALLDLLNDILDISKVEAGKLTLEEISFNLKTIIEDVGNLLAQNAHARNIELNIDIDPCFPEGVYGDPTRIRQIINNLTGNAIKFTEEGSVTIALTLDNDGINLTVQDTGIGISKDSMEKIFSPFSQAYSDTTRKFGGTGLGLTLCKQLITHMGGQLLVESDEKKGSVFCVKLPLKLDTSIAPFRPNKALIKSHVLFIQVGIDKQFDTLIKQLNYWSISVERVKLESISDFKWPKEFDVNDTIIILNNAGLCNYLPHGISLEKIILISFKQVDLNRLKVPLQITLIPPVSRELFHQSLCRCIDVLTTPRITTIEQSESKNKKDISLLLVEDNKVNQMVAKAILKKIGYKVTVVSDGKEAVHSVQHDHFDAILMDCHMPVMDGYEATKIIRKELKMTQLPIIAVTANVMHGDKERCFEAGMNDYISKPYEKEVLINIISKWVNT